MKLYMQLRKTRTLLGLTQKQFSNGIVTESFYSRVENNLTSISMVKLLEILKANHVSLYDFFKPLSNNKIEQKIIVAFIDQNTKKLEQYKAIKSNEINVKLMLAILYNKDLPLSRTCKDKLINLTKKDTKIEEHLLTYYLLAYVGNINDLKQIVMDMNKYKFDSIDDLSTKVLIHILLLCLARFYEENKFHYIKFILKILKGMPSRSDLVLEKLITQYYCSIMHHDYKKAENIEKVLKLTGYSKYMK